MEKRKAFLKEFKDLLKKYNAVCGTETDWEYDDSLDGDEYQVLNFFYITNEDFTIEAPELEKYIKQH